MAEEMTAADREKMEETLRAVLQRFLPTNGSTHAD
jgi:hypothetical protein